MNDISTKLLANRTQEVDRIEETVQLARDLETSMRLHRISLEELVELNALIGRCVRRERELFARANSGSVVVMHPEPGAA